MAVKCGMSQVTTIDVSETDAFVWTPKRISDLRRSLELTQARAAERLGVSTSTWVSWENGRRTPDKRSRRLLNMMRNKTI